MTGLSSLGSQQVRIPKAAAVVAGNMRRGIVRGRYAPGDALPNESELMELYGVSRPVVREALRILESESLIEIKRGARGGARFTLPDIGVAARHSALQLQLAGTTLADLFEARAMIEPAAVRRLAVRRDPESIQQLRAGHEQERSVVDDPLIQAEQAAGFHALLVEVAGNKTLAVLNRLLLQIVERHNRLARERLPPADAAAVGHGADECHGTTIDLIEDGDADAAEQLWREHLDAIAKASLERLGRTTIVDLLDGES